ncbi:MAG: alpha/beta hydrolase, partial [Chloroflexi bacterium]|nr:alpha/beta hydrolase [Chloroflexota bacterium]
PDMLGFGETDKPAIQYTEWRIARHLAAFTEMLLLDEIRLLGASKGAYWAARLMVDEPDRVRAFCAVGTATVARAMGIRTAETPGLRMLDSYDGSIEDMRRFVSYVVRIPDETMVAQRHAMSRLPGAAEAWSSLASAARRMSSDPNYAQAFALKDRLPRITLPMLLLWGDQDAFSPVEMGVELARLLPNMPLQLMPGTGHQCYNDDPAAFNEVVLDFFTRPPLSSSGPHTPR